MKAMTILFLSILTGQTAFANAPTVDGQRYTCPELKSLVAAEGALTIRGWLGGEHTYVSDPSACDATATRVIPGYDRSRDTAWCLIGYLCEGDHHMD